MIDAFFDVPVWFWAWLVVTAVPLQFAFRALGIGGVGVFPPWVWCLVRPLCVALVVVCAISAGASPATVGFTTFSLLVLCAVFEVLVMKRPRNPIDEAPLLSSRGIMALLFLALLVVPPLWGSQKFEELRIAELLNWSEYRGGHREVLLADPKFSPVEQQGTIVQWTVSDNGQQYELYSGIEGLAARDEFIAMRRNRGRGAVVRARILGFSRDDSPQLPDYLRKREIKIVRVEPTPWWVDP